MYYFISLALASAMIGFASPIVAHAEEPSTYETPIPTEQPANVGVDELPRPDVISESPATGETPGSDREPDLAAIQAGCRLILAGTGDTAVVLPTKPLTHTPPQALILNEVLPAPEAGNPEWVEITNIFQTLISTEGWSIRDATGKTVSVPPRLLGKDQYLVVEIFGSLLNNDTEMVELVDQNGEVVDKMYYSGATRPRKGESTAWDGTAWKRTASPTSGTPNVFLELETETAAPSATISLTPPPSSVYDTEATLRISEVYPNTTGDDEEEEFIEVYNPLDRVVLLAGWKITDVSGTSWTFGVSDTIAAKEVRPLMRQTTRITLNNTEETVTLLRPDGTTSDTLSYKSSAKGSTLSLFEDDTRSWTAPSPGQIASAPLPPAPAPIPAETQATAATAGSQKNTGAIFEGIVTALPNTFGSQFFYAQNEKDGIQIYSYKKLFPTLALGDRIRVHGEPGTTHSEDRLKTSTQEDIEMLGHGELALPKNVSISEIGKTYEGMLVHVQGTVAHLLTNGFTLSMDSATIDVIVKDAIAKTYANVTETAAVEATGIVSQIDGTFRILIRAPEDVIVSPSPTEQEPKEQVPIASKARFHLFIGGTLFSLTGGGLALFYTKRHSLKLSSS